MKYTSLACAAVSVAGIAFACLAVYGPRMALPDTGMLAVREIVRPIGAPEGIVFLLSGPSGYGFYDGLDARRLALSGSLVVGVDTPETLVKGEALTTANGDDCVYFVSDIEGTSQELQRRLDLSDYTSPIVAGAGLGGTFALALAAQTPDATIARTIAVDPGAVLPMKLELCSGAPHRRSQDGKGWTYGLQPGPLPDPIDVVETRSAPADGRQHTGALIAKGFAVTDRSVPGDRRPALIETIADAVETANSGSVGSLPLSPMPAKASHDTLAIILSGDGGWRDIDKEIGGALVKGGVPVVGLDSLRYFWKERQPDATAADLSRLIDAYSASWGVHKVALIGYSFGADLLPAVYDALPADKKAMVTTVALLAYSGARQFEIQVSGILGVGGDPKGPTTLDDLRKIPPSKIQCYYGKDDDESVCERLNIPGIDLIGRPGGHHFDDDYAPLAALLLDRITTVADKG